MVTFDQATYIDGTVNPGAILRRNTQRDAGTGSGVLRPGDLKIAQLDTPGAGVKIAAGDALVQSRAPGAERETYGVPLSTSQNYLGDAGTGIPGTGSSVPSGGRRDMVFLELLDPGLPTSYTPEVDWPEGQSVKLSIVQNVGDSALRIEDVPALANVTGYALALITYPASTATVTNAMITDLRALAHPRSERVLRSVDLTEDKFLTSTAVYPDGQVFPTELSGGEALIKIPEFATHVRVVATWASVRFPAGTNALGNFWVQISSNADPDKIVTPLGSFDAPGVGNQFRESWVKGATVAIPVSKRGKTHNVYPKARLNNALPVGERPYMNSQSSMILDLEFFEAVA